MLASTSWDPQSIIGQKRLSFWPLEQRSKNFLKRGHVIFLRVTNPLSKDLGESRRTEHLSSLTIQFARSKLQQEAKVLVQSRRVAAGVSLQNLGLLVIELAGIF